MHPSLPLPSTIYQTHLLYLQQPEINHLHRGQKYRKEEQCNQEYQVTKNTPNK